MAQPPSGVVSFLFTDIEGSTRLWQEDRPGMTASVALHNALLRALAEGSGGYVFATAGDGFAVAFDTPAAAIAAAVEIQLALLDAEWPGPVLRVRMGIHTGVADERQGDYFGPTLNRAARVMSSGNGGQILVSSVTARSAELWFDPPTTLVDVGTHHLRDIVHPEHLFEVRHPRLPVVDTPIRTEDPRLHNLPDHLSSFVGREIQLEELSGLDANHRLVVLTGVGGTGKTRLAVEWARDRTADFPDGVWIVELAPVTDSALVMTAIGEVWNLRPGESARIDEVVVRYLKDKHLLLIVDNCEHVLSEAARAILWLLDGVHGLTVMATSRESLGIAGEAILQVPSLSLPGDGVTDSEAARLLIQRATDSRSDFSPAAHVDAIARICRRIDGIPLGLELAAARLRSMSPEELADRLEHSFRILAGSAKTALPRQRTLSATIDWSHDLLEPAEALLFRRLAVFVGGFDLAAAEEVASCGGAADVDVLDLLDSLVDKSLVVFLGDREGANRYRLLEPVRQYAQEKLRESGEAHLVQGAHAGHFTTLIADAEPHLRGPGQVDWDGRLEVEYPNIRAALATLLEDGEIERYLEAVFNLFPYWLHTGMQIEAIETGLTGLARAADVDPRLRCKVWWTTAFLSAQITSPGGIDQATEGLVLARSIGDPALLARMELILGAAINHGSDDPGYVEHLLEGQRLLDRNQLPMWWGDPWEKALLNLVLGDYLPRDDARAREHLEAALEGFEQAGDRVLQGAVLSFTPRFVGMGHDEWINASVRRSVEILDTMKVPLWRGHAHFYFGIALRLQGDDEAAIEHLGIGAPLLEECGDLNCWAGAHRLLAYCYSTLGDHSEAVKILGNVINSLDLLPVRGRHQDLLVACAAFVLAHEGRAHEAGLVLGNALKDGEMRATMAANLEAARARAEESIGMVALEEAMARGATMDVDDVIKQVTVWLEEDGARFPAR